MERAELLRRVEGLLRDTAHAHHEAYAATDGADPEWPLWYAEHLQGPINALLGAELTRSELVYRILDAEQDRARRDPQADWVGFYAQRLLSAPTP